MPRDVKTIRSFWAKISRPCWTMPACLSTTQSPAPSINFCRVNICTRRSGSNCWPTWRSNSPKSRRSARIRSIRFTKLTSKRWTTPKQSSRQNNRAHRYVGLTALLTKREKLVEPDWKNAVSYSKTQSGRVALFIDLGGSMKINNCFRATIVALLILVTASGMWAQGTSPSITGTLKDASGAVITGATARATSVESGRDFTSVSNEVGIYNLIALPPGNYTVTVEAKGFKRVATNTILLEVNQVARVDLTLEVGAVADTVAV